MIQVTCSSCGSKLTAKPALAGQARKCPKCGARVQIPGAAIAGDVSGEETIGLDDASPEQVVHGVVEEHLPRPELPTRLERSHKYWILDKNRLIALWEGDGNGWLIKTNTGLVSAPRNADQLPAHGTFVFIELVRESVPEGHQLTGIRVHKLAERWALPNLAKSEDKILTQIRGPGSLNRDQKTVVRNLIKSRFMPEVWEGSEKVREYLSNEDFQSPGTD